MTKIQMEIRDALDVLIKLARSDLDAAREVADDLAEQIEAAISSDAGQSEGSPKDG